MSKQTNTVHAVKQGHLVRHEQTFEDNLLPSSQELANLKSVSPDLVDFVKDSARKEQDFRISYKTRELDIVSKNSTKEFVINYTGLFFAFIIMLSGMYFSTSLISQGFNIVGTIFAGGTLLLGVAIFINPLKKK